MDIFGRFKEPVGAVRCPDCEKRILHRWGNVNCARCVFNPAQPDELKAKALLLKELEAERDTVRGQRERVKLLLAENCKLRRACGMEE